MDSPVEPGSGRTWSSSSSLSRSQVNSSRERRNVSKARGPRLGRMSSSFRVFCRFVGCDSTSSTWFCVKIFSWYRNGTIVSLTSSCPDSSSRCVRSTALCTGSISRGREPVPLQRSPTSESPNFRTYHENNPTTRARTTSVFLMCPTGNIQAEPRFPGTSVSMFFHGWKFPVKS